MEAKIRRTLAGALAVVLPLLVLAGAGAWLLRPEPWAPSQSVQQIDANLAAKPFSTVVVGPSFSRTDVELRTLSENLDLEPKGAVTMAFNSAGPATWYALLKYRVFDAGYAPKLVVVVTTMQSLLAVTPSPTYLHDLTDQFAEPDDTIRELTFASDRPAWMERALQRRGGPRAALLKAFRDGPAALFYTGTDGADAETIADEAGKAVFGEEHEAGSFQMVGGRVADAHEELGLFGGGVADARQGYLPALARLVHAHGAQLVVVFAPTAARFQPSQYLPDAAEAEILALGNELGVGWVDLRQVKLSDDAFKDGRHMRPPAAKEFTLQLAERLTAIGATRPGPLVRPIAPLELQSVERIGAEPTLDLGTVAEGDGPCKATITLTGAASLAEPRLATLPWRRRSPIEVAQGGQLLKRTRGGEALTDGCVGKFRYADDRIDVRLAKGRSGAIELRLADALPVRDGKEDEAWWLWPSTSLKWSYAAPPEAEGAELTVDVEVRPVETAAAAPVVRVGERQVELSLESGRFVGSLSVPRPEGPWSIEVESPAGAAYAEVHALAWHVGEQRQDVVAPAVMRWVDLAKAAEVHAEATPAFAAAAVTAEGGHGWIAAPWRNVSGCSPLSVVADGAPLEHATPDSFDARKPPESGLAHLKDRLWFPAAAAGSSPAYTVGLDPERRCWAKACRSCGTRLWVYPGDKLTITPSDATRHTEGGLRLARVRVLAVAAAGETEAAPLAFELHLGDQTVATAALSLAAMAKGEEVPVRPPVIGDYDQPLTIVLENPAENPPMLFTLWGGAD